MKSSNKPKVSIIIPVYNVEKYLRVCINSVLDQTLGEIEVFLVDDGSTDGSWKIVQEFAEKDKRVIAIQQKNAGAAVARNKGLEQARGEYIGFVDSDDFVDKDYFEQLYKTAKTKKADMAVAYSMVGKERDSLAATIRKDNYRYDRERNDVLKNKVMFNKLDFRNVLWLVIYKRTMLEKHGIHFPPEIRNGQDEIFNIQASYFANKIEYVSKQTFYYYLERDGSITRNHRLTAGGVLSRAYVLKGTVNFLNSQDDYSKKVYISKVVKALTLLMEYFIRASDVDEQTTKQVVSIILFSWRKLKYKREIKPILATKFPIAILTSQARLDEYISEKRYDHHRSLKALKRRLKHAVKDRIKSNDRLYTAIEPIVPKIRWVIGTAKPKGMIGLARRSKKRLRRRLLLSNAHFAKTLRSAKKLHPSDHPKVVVSMTSYGRRLNTVTPAAIASLLNQSVMPDKIVLWIGHGEKITAKIKKLMEYGLEVKYTEDIRSYTKLIPALREYPNSCIVTVDDDIVYPPYLIKDLVDAHKKKPNAVISHRARKIIIEDGVHVQYNNWPILDNIKKSTLVLPTGVGGVLYPPSTFDERVFDQKVFLDIAPNVDDLWFWAASELLGVKRVVIRGGFRDLGGRDLDDIGLFNTGNRDGGNDAQFLNILNHFPEIKTKLGVTE